MYIESKANTLTHHRQGKVHAIRLDHHHVCMLCMIPLELFFKQANTEKFVWIFILRVYFLVGFKETSKNLFYESLF